MNERFRERERIARELHDTLLQGFQGLLLSLDASVRRVSDDALRRRMERDLTRAQDLLAEGRDRVAQLRQHVEADGEGDEEEGDGPPVSP
ncbi:histidine kinase [Roseateles sp. L2-2]|uniref:histidine kinase n=1 Tax=Roseateles TaxID=93681 RepID=UPI003D36DBDB